MHYERSDKELFISEKRCSNPYFWGSIMVWRLGGFGAFEGAVFGYISQFSWRFTMKKYNHALSDGKTLSI
jgi:hypothetical protein